MNIYPSEQLLYKILFGPDPCRSSTRGEKVRQIINVILNLRMRQCESKICTGYTRKKAQQTIVSNKGGIRIRKKNSKNKQKKNNIVQLYNTKKPGAPNYVIRLSRLGETRGKINPSCDERGHQRRQWKIIMNSMVSRQAIFNK